MQEILAYQDTRFTCTTEGRVEWRLKIYDNREDKIIMLSLAACDTKCLPLNTFNGLFIFSVVDVNNTDLIIRPANNTRLTGHVLIVNGSLQCIRGDVDHKSAECGLNYVCKYKVICFAMWGEWCCVTV